MPKLKHPVHEQYIVFVTATCFERSPFLQSHIAAELAIEQIDRLRKNKIWIVAEFVVMPDHVHLIFLPIKSIGYCMQEFKKSVAKLLNMHQNCIGRKIWLDEYYERIIRDEKEYLAQMEYIRLNPVKAELVQTPEEFPYSSVNPLYKMDQDLFY